MQKKKYQKLYHKNETLKKEFTKQQQEELLKCQNHLKNQTTSYVKKHDRKINLKDIDWDEHKLRNLFVAQKKKRRHYDYCSDDNDSESADDEYEDSGIEESDEDKEIITKKKKNIKK